MVYIMETMLQGEWPELLLALMQLADEKAAQWDLDEFFENLAQITIDSHNTIIKARNQIGIKILTSQPSEDKVFALVYGKWHIDDLIKQIQETYDNKVNIYVAK